MAKRMALVPESWLRQQPFNNERAGSSSSMHVSVVEPKKETELSDLAQFLPKSYRGRARILLHYLQGHIKLNEQQRVLYPPNDQLGSHLLDLVKYYVATFPTDRPKDAPKFAKLMTSAGVPTSAIVSKRNTWYVLSISVYLLSFIYLAVIINLFTSCNFSSIYS